MSVIIVLPNGTDRFRANWVFRQLASDVSVRYRNDDSVCKALESAEALGSLDFKDMDEELCRKVMQAIKTNSWRGGEDLFGLDSKGLCYAFGALLEHTVLEVRDPDL